MQLSRQLALVQVVLFFAAAVKGCILAFSLGSFMSLSSISLKNTYSGPVRLKGFSL